MIILDEPKARKTLQRVGLYRFKSFALEYQRHDAVGKPYFFATTFDSVERLMKLDEQLRGHIFVGTQLVEVGILQYLNNYMVIHHGEFWYTDRKLFSDNKYSLMTDVIKRFRSSGESFSEHFINTYDSHVMPPSWMILDHISFGALSTLYSKLDNTADASGISNTLGLHHNTLESWLKALYVLRNHTAHHGRIWNREYKPMKIFNSHATALISNLRNNSFDSADAKALRLAPRLYGLHYLTSFLDPSSTWTSNLKLILSQYRTIELKRMGFKPGWENQPEWQ